MAHFEQDKTYEDMDGNIRQFKFRDYTKKTSVGFAGSTGEPGDATREYHASLRETIDCLTEEVPAIFARDVDEVIEIINDKIEWNKEALFLAYKHYMSCFECMHVSSIWYRMNKAVSKSIKEHINCKDADCRDKIEKWRIHYKKTKTL